RAKAFQQRPSEVALLGDDIDAVGRYYFDRGIWAFGEAVASRLDAVSANTSNAAIARAQREREMDRLMGEDMTLSTAGFRDVSESAAPHDRIVGEPEADDDMAVEGSYW